MYGEKYGLIYKSTYGEGTIVQVRHPIIEWSSLKYRYPQCESYLYAYPAEIRERAFVPVT
jgi:hypothetical protein